MIYNIYNLFFNLLNIKLYIRPIYNKLTLIKNYLWYYQKKVRLDF